MTLQGIVSPFERRKHTVRRWRKELLPYTDNAAFQKAEQHTQTHSRQHKGLFMLALPSLSTGLGIFKASDEKKSLRLRHIPRASRSYLMQAVEREDRCFDRFYSQQWRRFQ